MRDSLNNFIKNTNIPRFSLVFLLLVDGIFYIRWHLIPWCITLLRWLDRNRTGNTMVKWKRTKRQTTIYKTLHRKLKIEQHEPNKTWWWTQMLRNYCTHWMQCFIETIETIEQLIGTTRNKITADRNKQIKRNILWEQCETRK